MMHLRKHIPASINMISKGLWEHDVIPTRANNKDLYMEYFGIPPFLFLRV